MAKGLGVTPRVDATAAAFTISILSIPVMASSISRISPRRSS